MFLMKRILGKITFEKVKVSKNSFQNGCRKHDRQRNYAGFAVILCKRMVESLMTMDPGSGTFELPEEVDETGTKR